MAYALTGKQSSLRLCSRRPVSMYRARQNLQQFSLET